MSDTPWTERHKWDGELAYVVSAEEVKQFERNCNAKIAALEAENAALRTGDTCARMCEGQAYRIEARRLKGENAALQELLQEARDVCYRAAEDELVARIDAARKS